MKHTNNYSTGCGDIIYVASVNISSLKTQLSVGESAFVRAEPLPCNATNKSVRWCSSDESIATVNPDSGLVTGQSVGTVTITATAVDRDIVKGVYILKIVPYVFVDSVAINSKVIVMRPCETEQVEVLISPANATRSKIYWQSSNECVATVDSFGFVKANKEGETLITATTIDRDGSRKMDCCKVIITANSNIQRIVNNIKNCSNSIIPSTKKDICIAMTIHMLSNGYELSFIAGLLANIMFEGNVGKFESSNYVSNPKPDYLNYMDTAYNGTDFYLNNYSGKTIMEVNVQTVWNMLNDLKTQSNNTWRIGGSRVGFGLGSIQWTFGRAYSLACLYKNKVGQGTTITTVQAISAEVTMIINELNSSAYSGIVADWRKDCANDVDSLAAANLSGSMLCYRYLIPYNTAVQATQRATRAEAIYEVIKD